MRVFYSGSDSEYIRPNLFIFHLFPFAGVIFLSILLRILGEYIYRLKKFLSAKMEKIQYQKKLEKQPGFSKNGQLPASQTKKQTNKHSKPVTSSHIECSLCCCWYSRKIGTGDDTSCESLKFQTSHSL